MLIYWIYKNVVIAYFRLDYRVIASLIHVAFNSRNAAKPSLSDYGECALICSFVQLFGDILIDTGPYSQLGYLSVKTLETLSSGHELLKSRIILIQWPTWCLSTVQESIGRCKLANWTYLFQMWRQCRRCCKVLTQTLWISPVKASSFGMRPTPFQFSSWSFQNSKSLAQGPCRQSSSISASKHKGCCHAKLLASNKQPAAFAVAGVSPQKSGGMRVEMVICARVGFQVRLSSTAPNTITSIIVMNGSAIKMSSFGFLLRRAQPRRTVTLFGIPLSSRPRRRDSALSVSIFS